MKTRKKKQNKKIWKQGKKQNEKKAKTREKIKWNTKVKKVL